MTLQILMCESEPMIANLVREYLTPLGFKVLVPHEKSPWSDVLKSKIPDVILIDTHLKGGVRLAVEKVRKLGLQSPILLLGANYGITSSEEAVELGANGFIDKPFRLKELLEQVLNLVPN